MTKLKLPVLEEKNPREKTCMFGKNMDVREIEGSRKRGNVT